MEGVWRDQVRLRDLAGGVWVGGVVVVGGGGVVVAGSVVVAGGGVVVVVGGGVVPPLQAESISTAATRQTVNSRLAR